MTEPKQKRSGAGGRARAKNLTPEELSAIAKKGLQTLADKKFGGDLAAAGAWLAAMGRASKGVAKDRLSIGLVRIDDEGRCMCPFHGIVEGAEYEPQDPAPCGCAWILGRRGLVMAVLWSPLTFGDADAAT